MQKYVTQKSQKSQKFNPCGCFICIICEICGSYYFCDFCDFCVTLLFLRDIISHSVDIEKFQAGPFAAEVPPLKAPEEPVPQPDEPPYRRNVNPAVEGQYPRIPPQLVAERVERPHTALNLPHVVRVLLKLRHHHRVVDVADAHPLLFQHLPEQHILVAAPREPLVEAARLKHPSLDHEVRRAKLLIPVRLSLLGRVSRLGSLLVEIAQVVSQSIVVRDSDAAVYHTLVVIRYVALQEMVVGDGDVAVEEQQPGVLALRPEEVTRGGTTAVRLFHDIPAVG